MRQTGRDNLLIDPKAAEAERATARWWPCALGMKAVADGVESAAALDLLRELGCDQAQGYFIARPIAAADVPDMVLTHRQSDWFRTLQSWHGQAVEGASKDAATSA